MCNGVIEGAVAIIATVVEAASEASAVIGVGALATEGASLIAECAGDPALANVFGSLSKIFGAVAGVAGGAGAIVSGLGEAAATVGADSVATSLGTDLSTAASNPDLESLLAAHHLISGFGSLGLMLSGNSKAAEYFGLVSGAAGGALGLAQGGTALSQAAAATTFGSSMGGLALESSGNKEAAAALGVVGGLGASGMTFADWGGVVPPNWGQTIEPPEAQVGGGGGRYYFDQEPTTDAEGAHDDNWGSAGGSAGTAGSGPAAQGSNTPQVSGVGSGSRVYTGTLPEGSVWAGDNEAAGVSYYSVPGMSSLLVVPLLQVNNTPLTAGAAVQEIFDQTQPTPTASLPGGSSPGASESGDIYQQADAEHEAELEEVYGTKRAPAASGSSVGMGLASRSPSTTGEGPSPGEPAVTGESSDGGSGALGDPRLPPPDAARASPGPGDGAGGGSGGRPAGGGGGASSNAGVGGASLAGMRVGQGGASGAYDLPGSYSDIAGDEGSSDTGLGPRIRTVAEQQAMTALQLGVASGGLSLSGAAPVLADAIGSVAQPVGAALAPVAKVAGVAAAPYLFSQVTSSDDFGATLPAVAGFGAVAGPLEGAAEFGGAALDSTFARYTLGGEQVLTDALSGVAGNDGTFGLGLPGANVGEDTAGLGVDAAGSEANAASAAGEASAAEGSAAEQAAADAASKTGGSWWPVRDVRLEASVVAQQNPWYCSPAAGQMLADSAGVTDAAGLTLDQSEIAVQANTTTIGTDDADLVAALNKMNSNRPDLTFKDFANIPNNAGEVQNLLGGGDSFMAGFKTSATEAHAVVVDGITPNGLVTIRDPGWSVTGEAVRYEMTMSAFLRAWDGTAVAIVR